MRHSARRHDKMEKSFALRMYHNMVTLQTMDTLFYEAQRQGRFSFYLTTIGEEAINIASAAALHDDDIVYAQYREPGVLMWRGFTLAEFANQCFSTDLDYGKGRQMPVQYGSSKLNYPTVSSPIATQLPHAVGAAYALKMDNKPTCTATFFGEGASSEALTYRVGHHSTSDDSGKYRKGDEMHHWRFVVPISTIFEKLLCGRRSLDAEDAVGVELGKPLPGSDAVEASRRRERGARALEKRLSTASKGGVEGVAPKSSSKGNLESLASDELV